MLVIKAVSRLPLMLHWAAAFLTVHHAKPLSWIMGLMEYIRAVLYSFSLVATSVITNVKKKKIKL